MDLTTFDTLVARQKKQLRLTVLAGALFAIGTITTILALLRSF